MCMVNLSSLSHRTPLLISQFMGFPIFNPWGARFTSIFSIFSAMAGWIVEMLFMLNLA